MDGKGCAQPVKGRVQQKTAARGRSGRHIQREPAMYPSYP